MIQKTAESGSRVVAFPELAPLPTPIILHEAEYNDSRYPRVRQPAAGTLDEELTRAADRFRMSRSDLEQKVRDRRRHVYDQMNEVVEKGELSTSWILTALSETHPVTRPTVGRWRGLNLIGYEGHDRPVADTVAAILIASQIDPRPRGWLPSEVIQKDEPHWWCWRQDAPGAPIVPCPVPLPNTLPPTALLWTPWPGAAWDARWLSVGTGSVRWAHTKMVHNKLLWDISLEDLKKWDPGVFPLSAGVLENAPEVLHSLAQLALVRLAAERLNQKPDAF